MYSKQSRLDGTIHPLKPLMAVTRVISARQGR